tara:strand:+ start:2034 stop:3485 length:1452 start_codon:yes stop_codon:yes gene_type:complete
MKCGIVITTYGNNGIYAKQCLDCFLRNVPNAFVVFFVNTSEDEKTLSIQNQYSKVKYIYIEDQKKNGGLTATWNEGIKICIENKCQVIILSNDDVFFDKSIKYIIKKAEDTDKDDMKYFGPLTNNPGPSVENKATQYSTSSLDEEPYECQYNDKKINLNGFFMVFPTHVLKKNMFDKKHYFDPSFPFGGNEVEWFKRFINKGGTPMVVPQTFVYHYKLKSWRKNQDKDQEINDTCIFTINFGNYEKTAVYLENNTDIDTIYVTDNSDMREGTQIHKCIERDITFFYYDTKKIKDFFNKIGILIKNEDCWWPFHKQLQRMIKADPLDYLPSHYKKTLYLDGDRLLTKKIYKKDIDNFLKEHDIVCFDHPYDRGSPKQVAVELDTIQEMRLEKKENINKIRKILEENNFPDDIGLSETSILIRNHEKLKEFSKEWQDMVQICIRDQASFEYLLWKHQVNFQRLSIKKRFTTKKGHRNARQRFLTN